jgi:hypothetical protein
MHHGYTGAAAAALIVALSGPPDAPREAPKHPVPAAPLRALPSLGASDDVVRDAVRRIHGTEALGPMLSEHDVVRRFVANVDAAARGTCVQCRAALHAMADVDARAAARLYSRLYPLLQQAYEEQSPGKGYFNDRTVEAIDRLLDDDVLATEPALGTLRQMRTLIALRSPGG